MQNWWSDNFLTNLNGPAFLYFYVAVVVTVIALCWWSIRKLADRDEQPLPKVPLEPDPYEIAWLRGGNAEVCRLALFSLLSRGQLQSSSSKARKRRRWVIEQSADWSMCGDMSPIEREVFGWFSRPIVVPEIFKRYFLKRLLLHTADYWQNAKSDRLLKSSEERVVRATCFFLGGSVLLGLGSYRLVNSLVDGRTNLLLLVVLMLVSCWILKRICHRSRLSRRGRLHVENLQQAFRSLKERMAISSTGLDHAGALLVCGLFGLGILKRTPYHSISRLFQKGSASSFHHRATGESGCGAGWGYGGFYVGSCGCCSSSSGCSGSSSGCSSGGGGCAGCGGCSG